MKNGFQIAIDGPVGAGKSTVAKKVAERMGFLFVDTGAMYRAVALAAKQRGVDWRNEEEVLEVLERLKIVLKKPEGSDKDGRKVSVYLQNKDVSWEIRDKDMGEGASIVSTYKKVRDKLVELQKSMAKDQSVVMEGRDIGTRVLPEADLKIFLTANVDERARRKAKQMQEMGKEMSFEEAKKDVLQRDEREVNREIDPLRPTKSSWVFDTTELSEEQVVDRICRRVT